MLLKFRGKPVLRQIFNFTQFDTATKIMYTRKMKILSDTRKTIDNQYTKRTRLPDQPFGLGDSSSAVKLTPFQALFSRPTEFGLYIDYI